MIHYCNAPGCGTFRAEDALPNSTCPFCGCDDNVATITVGVEWDELKIERDFVVRLLGLTRKQIKATTMIIQQQLAEYFEDMRHPAVIGGLLDDDLGEVWIDSGRCQITLNGSDVAIRFPLVDLDWDEPTPDADAEWLRALPAIKPILRPILTA